MMKSFFKKLAFVMALAMVVTTAAPAANVFAAEFGIVEQNDATWTIVETANVEVEEKADFKFVGAPKNWAELGFVWTSSDEDVATVNQAGVVTGVADGVATITLADKANTYVATLEVTVGEGVVEEVKAEEMGAKQLTANTVRVTFTNEHGFDATGADSDDVNTVKVYRVFSSEEMAKMSNKNGLKFDEEGNGYQAYYIQDTAGVWNADYTVQDLTSWDITGYNWFVDGANYAVVYGENETSSTINGIKCFFTAYIGKVAKIVISATQATVENEVESAIPAKLTTRLYNMQDVDLTSYYKNADDTDYEFVSEDVEASISGDEVTFDAPGVAVVMGTYTYYDEETEKDVVLTSETPVFGDNYSTYRVDSIYEWSLKSGYKSPWKETATSMIAGDTDELYVIVKDNRGNYYSNVPGIETVNNGKGHLIGGKKVLEIGDSNDNTPFEQYGYELVFDSLDPDSLLVDPDGYVESYKKTNSFAVVSYKRTDDDSNKLYEIGVMGIEVKAARRLDDVYYKNGTTFTVLKETEAEDGATDFYNSDKYPEDSAEAKTYAADFKLKAYLQVVLQNQYDKTWADNAEDWGEVDPEFTVTTSKDEFDDIANDIAYALNTPDDEGNRIFVIDSSLFAGTNTTSVTFKIKETVTGDSQSVTIKLDKPKYVTDDKGNETGVYVDPSRAMLNVGEAELYYNPTVDAKLFQVSKANQKVGYFRIDTNEVDDEKHGYYVATTQPGNFIVKPADKGVANFVTTSTGSALTTSTLKEGDYVLVITDPNGKVFPVVGEGGNGKAFGEDSLLGVVPTDDGTAYTLIAAAEDPNSHEMEYATAGTYRASVYKITKAVVASNGNIKYNTTRVSSDTFKLTCSLSNAKFYHQEETKDVAVSSFHGAPIYDKKDDTKIIGYETDYDAVLKAISDTMTFSINGRDFTVDNDGEGTYKSNTKLNLGTYWDYTYNLKVELVADAEHIDVKVQADGKRAVINTVTFRFYTPVGGYYENKVKVNRSVNIAD